MAGTTAPKTTTRKRKSDTATTTTAKKAKVVDYSVTEGLIDEIIARKGDMDIDAGEALSIAEYAKYMKETAAALKPVEKSAEQVQEAAAKLKGAAASGIKKQMKWRPSCKTSGAAWSYDGVCADATVFGAILNIDGPPTFKMKKYTVDEFQGFVGYISASAMYNSMDLLGNVNVRWDAAEGTFKFSGKYGVRGL